MSRRTSRPEWNRRKPTLREAALTSFEDLGEGVRRVVLSLARWDGDEPAPGQFMMMRVSATDDPLLFRPLGFSSFARRGLGAEVEAWFRVVGQGTRLMSRWAVDDRAAFIGPLGNGFPPPAPGERVVMVAGGIGLPPLLFLARSLRSAGREGEQPLLLYGAKTRRSLHGIEALEQAGVQVVPCTEDGSLGTKGLVTALLAGRDLSGARVYACGPSPMLAAVWREAKGRGLSLHLSLEARMGCGFGVCAGCAVRGAPPAGDPMGGSGPDYLRVCKDGPVFDAGALVEESFLDRPGDLPGGGKCGCGA